MKNQHLILAFVLVLISAFSAFGQQASEDAVIQGYQYLSASSGVLSSPTMTIIQPEGQFEKNNDDAFVFQLPPGETLGCRFALPEKAYNIEAIVTYNVPNKDVKGLIFWNEKLFQEEQGVLDKGKNDDLIQKKIPLKDVKQNNLLKIVPFGGTLQIRSIKILYNYTMPSCTVDDVTVTLLSPDPDLDSLTTPDLTLKWKGTGPCEKGWITIKYKDGEEWKTVPGAEAFDMQEDVWKDKFHGQYVWKNHGLKSFPELKIEYIAGKSLKREKADQLAEELPKLFLEQKYDQANRQIDAALALFPNNEFYKQTLIKIVEKIFSPDERKAGDRAVVVINGMEFPFRWCPPGEFMMGSPEDEEFRYDDEIQHKVKLTRGFWMLETQVTQAMWQSVMGENPSSFKEERNPVECVSWGDSHEFCKKLSQKLGQQVQLPTEAQWEYACRAGTTTPFNFGSTLNGDKANCDGNYPYGTSTKGPYLKKTAPVGSYKPNAWGLYDMHGNVWEWCSDYWDENYYSKSPTSDPENTTASSFRVFRGGCWSLSAGLCRSAYRCGDEPGDLSSSLGLRVLLVPSPAE